MITRPVDGGLVCVHQLDHAALSGRLAEAWGGPSAPELVPRASVVVAAGLHDAGWPDLDADPVYDPDTGAPHTYRTHGLAEGLAVAERSVDRVTARDRYAGWLVSRHFSSFHERSTDPRARRWVEAEAARRAARGGAWAPGVGDPARRPRVLEANFDWLQLLDAVSLALCHGWERWTSRPMALDYSGRIGTLAYERTDLGPTRVAGRLRPWPFAVPAIAAAAPARRLDGTRWSDPDALAAAWREGEAVPLEAVLSRA